MPNIRWLLALITRIHRFLYQVTDGRIGENLGKRRVLLLSYRGRRTGLLRVTPLLYVQEGESFVVVASNAGDDRAPAWWLNLRSKPEARIQVGRLHAAVQAREANDAERERLWPLLEASYGSYAQYRQRTEREIPIVILDPA